MRTMCIVMLGHERYGACARDLVLLAALADGPLAPNKASDVWGIPRGTAARRLAHPEACGLVQRRAGGAYTLTCEGVRRLGTP